jgi:hypothetical protein
MNPTLHIIASCSGRKREPAGQDLRIHAIHERSIEKRHQLWIDRLRRSSGTLFRGDELYAGDHATVLRSSRALAAEKGWTARLWILSAGYGLVSETQEVRSYSATFANGDVDSVSADPQEKAQWWNLCCAVSEESGLGPRSLRDLLEREEGATFVVIASPRYLEAVAGDLTLGIDSSTGSTVRIISSKNPVFTDSFKDSFLAVSADQATLLGGTLSSLHARVAREIIGKDLLAENIRDLRKRFGTLLGVARRTPGQRATDEQVLEHIKTLCRQDPHMPATRALAVLRGQGVACEQKRFGSLFAEARRRESLR